MPPADAPEFDRFRTLFERYPVQARVINDTDGAVVRLVVPLIAILIGLLLIGRVSTGGFVVRTDQRSGQDRAGVILLAAGCLIAGLESLIPRSAWSNWDAWAVWDFKTKAVLREGWLPRGFLTDPAYRFTHPEYPLMWPWLQAGLASLNGGLDTRLLRIVAWSFAVIAASAVSALLAEAGMRRGRWLTAGMVATLPIVLNHSSNGYVDWPLAAVESAALLLALRCARGRAPGWAVGLAAGLAANLKMEGMIFGAGVLAGMALARGRRSSLLQAAGVFLVLALPWQLYRSSLGITPADFGLPVGRAVSECPQRTFLFLRAFLLEAFGAGPNGRTLADWWMHLSSSWLVFWFVAGYAVLTGWRRLGDVSLRIPVVVVGVQILGALGAYVFTIRDAQWLLTASLDRLMLQWVPAVTLIAAVLLARRSRSGGPVG